jgi:hypothetical protein
MVANRVTESKLTATELGKSLVKIKMSKDKRNIKNMTEWDEALRMCFSTVELSLFLTKYSGIQVPNEEVARLLIQRQVNTSWASARREMTKTSLLSKQTGDGLNKSFSSTDEGEEKGGVKVEQDIALPGTARRDMSLYQKNLVERAKLMAKACTASSALAEKRGVRRETIFVNPLTCVLESEAHINPNANVLIEWEGETHLYEVEDDESRRKRLLAWQLITASLGELPRAFWKHIPMGNVSSLYELVTGHFMDTDRMDVVAKLTKRLAGLVKTKDELFIAFVARFEQLMLEMKEVDLTPDPDVLFDSVERALMESDDRDVKRVYENVCTMNGKLASPRDLFERMLPAMKRLEKTAREKHDLSDSENEWIENKLMKKKKKKEKKREESMTALRVRERSISSDTLLGVCVFFQEGNCKKGKDCSFKHKKLSKNEFEKLKDIVKKRKEEKEKNDQKSSRKGSGRSVTCFACDEVGHIDNACPVKEMLKGKEKTTDKVGVKAVRTESVKALLNAATAAMTDDQVKLFAKSLAEAQRGEGAAAKPAKPVNDHE